MWKHFVTGYFTYSKRERNGIITLLFLILLSTIVPFFFPFFIRHKTYGHSVFEKEIAALKIKAVDSASKFEREHSNHVYPSTQSAYSNKLLNGELFYFDPNTATGNDWKRLGLRDKTIATLQKYISKGGRFYKPGDIAKIWGLHPEDVTRLIPYIKIRDQFAESKFEKRPFDERTYEKPPYKATFININEADSSALVALPGIGPGLSRRILKFRDALGGFYAIEQVGETFGLADSIFQKIKGRLHLENPVVRQININTATMEEMKAHPYLRYAIANAIVQYRGQHGNYTSVGDIKKIILVTAEIYERAAPYLKVN